VSSPAPQDRSAAGLGSRGPGGGAVGTRRFISQKLCGGPSCAISTRSRPSFQIETRPWRITSIECPGAPCLTMHSPSSNRRILQRSATTDCVSTSSRSRKIGTLRTCAITCHRTDTYLTRRAGAFSGPAVELRTVDTPGKLNLVVDRRFVLRLTQCGISPGEGLSGGRRAVRS